MRNTHRLSTLLLAVAGVALSHAPCGASPMFSTPGFHGQPNTTSQLWDGYTSPAGPNPATTVSNPFGTPNWFDKTAASDGTFDIGSPPNAHIYSFSGVPTLETVIPTPVMPPNWLTSIVLQVETQGNELSPGSFIATANGIGNVPASSVIKMIGGADGQGGSTEDWLVTWNNLPGNSPAYRLDYAASDTSVSQVGTEVDTVTVAPEPAIMGLAGLAGGALLLRRSRNRRQTL